MSFKIQNPVLKKEAENSSTVDSEDENLILSSSEINKHKQALIKYEIVNMKMLPNVFFALFLVVFCLISIKYVPSFYLASKENHFLHLSSSVNSFSEFFSNQGPYLKVK